MPRRIRRNPLTGWDNRTRLTAKDVAEPLAPMLIPSARAEFERVYLKVPLPVYVLMLPEDSRTWDSDRVALKYGEIAEQTMPLAQVHNSLVIAVVLPERIDLSQAEDKTRFYVQPDNQRGSSFRTTPYSPFTLLHRVADELLLAGRIYSNQNMRGWTLDCQELAAIDEVTQMMELTFSDTLGPVTFDTQQTMAKVFSRGVDTQAGRMGVLIADQVIPDLFAKFLMSGKVAYDEFSPPPESKREALYRKVLAANLPGLLAHLLRGLQLAVPAVVIV